MTKDSLPAKLSFRSEGERELPRQNRLRSSLPLKQPYTKCYMDFLKQKRRLYLTGSKKIMKVKRICSKRPTPCPKPHFYRQTQRSVHLALTLCSSRSRRPPFSESRPPNYKTYSVLAWPQPTSQMSPRQSPSRHLPPPVLPGQGPTPSLHPPTGAATTISHS